MDDLVIYGDTDSLFYSVETFIDKHVGLDKWNLLTMEQKTEYSKQIASIVSDYVNNKAYKIVQRNDFNSQRKDFRIVFEQEIIASAGLFVAKKKYGLKIIDKDGKKVDELFIRGLEIIQSLTPRAIKPKLRIMLEMIISGADDQIISKTMRADRKELSQVHVNDIAVNIGTRNLDKYIVRGEAIKGTPWGVRAINNYHNLLYTLSINDKYERIGGIGEKIRVVYIKQPNPYGIETIGFIKWPAEFDSSNIKVDYDLMIDKYYTKKIEHLLIPINKGSVAYGCDINSFFGE